MEKIKVKGDLCCTKLIHRKGQDNVYVYEVFEKVDDLSATSLYFYK